VFMNSTDASVNDSVVPSLDLKTSLAKAYLL
jgi:hypothetical protein